MKRIIGENAVSFSYLPMTKFKTNYFEVCFVINLEREYTTKLSLLSGVLSRASENYPGIAEINNRLDYLYDMNVSMRSFKRGERLVLSYECDFLKNEFLPDADENLLSEAVEMFRELVFRPYLVDGGFDKKILDSEKTDLANSIKSIINYKNSYVREKCIETLCKGEKYAVNEQGNLEDIDAVTGESLYDFYKWLISNARIEVFFCGETDAEKTAEDFERIFAENTDRTPLSLCETYITGDVKKELCEVTEEMEVNQGKLALGFRTGVGISDKDAASLTLFCEILGGSPMSKLFMNVREKLSLCYYCRSVLDTYKGIMLILSGIQSENRDKSFDAIMNELLDIQKGVITEDEFSAAKLSIINSYKTLEDAPAGLCTWYMSRIICDNFMTPSDVVNAIEKVTLSDVVEVSKKVKLDTVYFLKGTDIKEEAEA